MQPVSTGKVSRYCPSNIMAIAQLLQNNLCKQQLTSSGSISNEAQGKRRRDILDVDGCQERLPQMSL